MTPDEVRDRYTFAPGDRVRYLGMDMWGVVQSVWEVTDPQADVRMGTNYTVTWVTGQTTTVPAGYVIPYGHSGKAELVLVSTVAFIAFVVGMAIPFIGWLCIAAPVAVAYAEYLRQRRQHNNGRTVERG